MIIGKNKISKDSKVFIIAEVGINHGGSFKECIKLVNKAKESGADAVKLQLIDADSSYQKYTQSFKEFSRAALSERDLIRIKKYAESIKIILFATPGDFKSLKLIPKLKCKAIKISSGLLTNIPLIKAAAKLKLPIILSSGMAYKNEISQAIKAVKKINNKGVAVLKCTSVYPAQDNILNLSSILEYKKIFKVPIGYSDHSLGIEACIAAVSLGARIIEKHFTLNKKKKGADHQLSLEPKEFKKMVKIIRKIETMLGDPKIYPSKKEIRSRSKYHRYLVANGNIFAGEKISLVNIGIKRLSRFKKGTLKPIYTDKLVGKVAKKNILNDQKLTIGLFK
ncbi:N-acetylneuraminate synthase family protein [Pelagibacteraceae bacterium]|jgi:N,N'-diacetyllegionaminate synthase|nr:N-acetylneuraminate synthase family protein [Pelagibacteraceae bacterium]